MDKSTGYGHATSQTPESVERTAPSRAISKAQTLAERQVAGFNGDHALAAGVEAAIEAVPIIGIAASVVNDYQQKKDHERLDTRMTAGFSAVGRELDRHEAQLGRQDDAVRNTEQTQARDREALISTQRVVLAMAERREPAAADLAVLRASVAQHERDRERDRRPAIGIALNPDGTYRPVRRVAGRANGDLNAEESALRFSRQDIVFRGFKELTPVEAS